ncbi:MAG: ankyrin repeat domain-containing protein [Tateyamaria sp.]|nr:ankyrin repeat domain-containing protein [Tateyamaria sp.]
MQKQFLAVVLMFFAMSSAVWAECGKLCDYGWWETATASDVRAELDAGADVNTHDEKGYTPLHWAAGNSSAEIVLLLIATGADVNTRTEDGTTTLHSAVGNSSAETIEALIAAGADVMARNEYGFTPLHLAASQGTAEMIQLLIIAAGADITAKDNRGRSVWLLDLSRFDAAPLIAFTVTKETDYGIETDGGIPPRCGGYCADQWAYPQTGG